VLAPPKFIANTASLRKPKKEFCAKNPVFCNDSATNMTDWPIKALARSSFLSGRSFAVGEQVACVIYRAPEGLLRADLSEAEARDWQPPGEVLGRWVRAMDDAAEAEHLLRRQALASAEEMFLALAQETGGAGPDKELLMQFLALMLERKRVLRPVGPATGGRQRYLHVKTQAEFAVAQQELDAARVALLQKQLQHLAY
jgi:hypothetical protein